MNLGSNLAERISHTLGWRPASLRLAWPCSTSSVRSDALSTLKLGLSLGPHRPAWGWFWLATVFHTLQLYPEATEAYREALRLEPEFQAARRNLIVVLRQGGNLDAAESEIEALRNKSPQNPWVWGQVGFLAAERDRDAAAVGAYERALDLDPRQADVWRALVAAYRRLGRSPDARQAYEQLLTLDRRQSESAYRENFLPFENAQKP